MNTEKLDYPFIRYPKALIDSPFFTNISIESRTLLAMILDRFSLSEINSDRFTDENGNVYVIYTIEEVNQKLGCSNTKTLRLFKELENNEMIFRKRKNRLSPYRIYITNTFYESIKYELATSQIKNSRVHNLKSHELSKREDSKNNNSNNNNINIQSFNIRAERTNDMIKEQISYYDIVCEENKKLLDKTVSVMSEIYNGKSVMVKIGKEEIYRGLAVSKICRLRRDHVSYVLSLPEIRTHDFRHIKPVLSAALCEAPTVLR